MNMAVRTENFVSIDAMESLGVALDQIRAEALADLGQRDADYIHDMIRKQRYCEIGGRALTHFSLNPLTWAAGVGLLSVSKILENMEIGHNVMHGQYDWMNEPELNSQRYEWDTTCDGDSWRKTHNYEHHTFTNIIGKDRDFGYGVLRLSDDIPWHIGFAPQLLTYAAMSVLFQYAVALHELEVDRIARKEITWRDKIPFAKRLLKKAAHQAGKDYVLFPLLAGPMAPKVFVGNALANLARNLWASTIIYCGHFTENAHAFAEADCQNETRGQWYYRQVLGSSNFTGGKWLHILSGHLSFQTEHHLFPDIPAHRYPELSEKVRAVLESHGIPYNTGSFGAQYRSVLKRLVKFSLP